jgi:serine/threonine-protein kinase
MMARFADEARIAGSLEHPSIVPIYDFGIDDCGSGYLCMKLVEGETLEETLNWAGSLRLEPELLSDLLYGLTRICDAVEFAHTRGVIHRDIKPANVMSADFGQVYLLDWGIASREPDRSLRTAESSPDGDGLMIGTPSYMAPEQLYGMNDRLDQRTDIFGLGATLYQILAGRPPRDFSLRSRGTVTFCSKIRPPADVVASGVPPWELSRVALKAMAPDPADRYASVAAFKRDIERFRRAAWSQPARTPRNARLTTCRDPEDGCTAYDD